MIGDFNSIGAVTAVALVSGGLGYTANLTNQAFTFSGGLASGGTAATGTYSTNANGTVTSISITSAGSGYISAPTIPFLGSPTNSASVTVATGAYVSVGAATDQFINSENVYVYGAASGSTSNIGELDIYNGSITTAQTPNVLQLYGGLVNIGANTGGLTLAGVLTATPGSGVTSVIQGTAAGPGVLTLPNAASVIVADSGTQTGLNLNVKVAQAAGTSLTKTGDGTLTLNPPASDTYAGTTVINEGTLVLGATANVVSIPTGAITVGDSIGGDGQDVLKFASGSVNTQIAAGVNVTINNSGMFTLNNIGTSASPVTIGSLTMVGGTFNVGTGYVILNGNIAGQYNTANINDPYTTTRANVATISGTGTIALGGAVRTIDTAQGLSTFTDAATGLNDLADMVIQPTLADGVATSGLTKLDSGILRLAGASTYSGATTVSAGTLLVDGSLSSSGTATVASGSRPRRHRQRGGRHREQRRHRQPGGSDDEHRHADRCFGRLYAGGTLLIQVSNASDSPGTIPANAGNYDQFVVQGNLKLGGSSNLTVNLAGLNSTGSALSAVTAANLNGTTFATVTSQNSTSAQAAAAYTPSGTPTSVNVVVSDVATKLVFNTQPANSSAGQAISPALQVYVEDASGNVDTLDDSNVTLTIGTNPGTGILGGTVTMAAVNGVATFSSLFITQVGMGYTLSAADGSLTVATSGAFNITPAAPYQLAFSQQPTTTVAGQAIGPAVTVQVLDQYGNLVTTDNTDQVTLGIASGPGIFTSGATATATVSAGVATFGNLVLDTAGSYTLSESATGGITGLASTSFVVTPNAAGKQLVITTQPSSAAAAGVPFGTQPVVKEEDNFGNVFTGDSSSTVTAARGLLGSTALQGANLIVTLNQGVATFSGLSYDCAETMNIVFSTSAGSFTTTSNNVVVSPDTAVNQLQLVITQQPSNTATAGVSFGIQPILKEEDAFGNVITSDSSSTVTAARGTVGTAALQGSNLTATLNQGVGTFSGLSYDVAETMNITFSISAGSFTTTSSSIVVSPNTAANQLQLVVTQQPSNTATAGVNFTTQPIVKEEDAFGNVITSDSSSSVTAARGNQGTASLQGGNFTVMLSQGVATFTGLSYDVAETMDIQFSSSVGSFTTTSGSIAVSPDTAVNQLQLVITQQPSTTATAGVNFTIQPVVKEEDAFGNVITSDSSSAVTAARGSLGTASLQGTNLAVTLNQGVATFAGLSYDTAETMNITFVSNAGSFTTTSNSIVVSPNTTANQLQLVITQQPSATATAGVSFVLQPIVKEEDAFGNVITSDNSSTVTATRGTVGTATLQGTNLTVTVVQGVASFSVLSYDVAETMNITFSTSAGNFTRTSSSIVVSPNAASKQLVITTQPSSTATAGVSFGTEPIVTEEDAFGNIFTSDDSSTVTAATGTQGSTILQGASLTVTVDRGAATFSGLSYDRAETMNITFSTSAGSFTTTSSSIVVSPNTAANQLQLVITQQPSATAAAGITFATQPVVKEEDAYGNVITSDSSSTVTAARGLVGTATLQGTNLTATLGQGVATFSGLSYDMAEAMDIIFSTSAGSFTTTSSSVTVSPNTAANQLQLVIAQQPSATATAGVNFATQPIVEEEDAFGNIITSDDSSTVTAARPTWHGRAARHEPGSDLESRCGDLFRPVLRPGGDDEHHVQHQRRRLDRDFQQHRRQPEHGREPVATGHCAAALDDGDGRRRLHNAADRQRRRRLREHHRQRQFEHADGGPRPSGQRKPAGRRQPLGDAEPGRGDL